MIVFLFATALAQDDAPERYRFFMPAVELGTLWHADETIRPGLLFRTSLDFRFRRVNAPFLRLSYDATTARLERADEEGTTRLVATLALHDVVIGGGYRLGSAKWQLVGSVQFGAQIADTPVV
ncbi:MAG: hypothetical protein AAF211_18230, partial [Myxococcota bacterium]